jgi:hypothetical protein
MMSKVPQKGLVQANHLHLQIQKEEMEGGKENALGGLKILGYIKVDGCTPRYGNFLCTCTNSLFV